MTNSTINTNCTTLINDNKKAQQEHIDALLREGMIDQSEHKFLSGVDHTNILRVYYGDMEGFKEYALTESHSAFQHKDKTEIMNRSITPFHGIYSLGEYRDLPSLGLKINDPASMHDEFTATIVTDDYNVIIDGFKKRNRDTVLCAYIPSNRF